MDTMQEIMIAFKLSAKRLLVFQEQLGDSAVAREEMGRRSKLKVLCETRWASRADCLSVFVDTFQVKTNYNHLTHQSQYKLNIYTCIIHQYSGYSRNVEPTK